VALSLAVVPAASASTSGTLVLNFETPSKLVMTFDGTVDGEDAANFRSMMDQSGNHDGTVSADEVRAFQESFKGFVNGAGEQSNPTGGAFTMDGKEPKSFTCTVFEVHNAEGPVSSTAAMQWHAVLQSMFELATADTHTLKVGESNQSHGGSSFDFKSAVLKAPKGFIISSTTGLPSGATVANDKKSIDFTTSVAPPSGTTTIVFQKQGGFAPGAPALALLAVVGLVVAARRRQAAP
jgi:hypothetical protein